MQLAQRMNLTRAAMTAIVNDLLEADIICEASNRPSSAGRPAITLEINPKRGCVAGVDMGATHLTIMISNCAAHVVTEKEIPLRIADGPQICLDQADALLHETLHEAGIKLEELLAIGLGVPGPIMAEAGTVVAPPIMPGWDRFPIRDTLEKRWGHPLSLNNDAELGAVGEWAYGAARSVANLAYIKVGTGVGAGLLLDGRIYRGASGSAGEIGHLTVETNGELCTCGNIGCLETISSGQAIARRAQQALSQPLQTQMAQQAEPITARDVANYARRGDLTAQQILADAGSQLGIAIAGLINLINPDMVVVGGGVAQIGDLFLEPVRREVLRRGLPASARSVQITTALLGRRSISMGAVAQAISIALHQIADDKPVQEKLKP